MAIQLLTIESTGIKRAMLSFRLLQVPMGRGLTLKTWMLMVWTKESHFTLRFRLSTQLVRVTYRCLTLW
jgi:hypothetical protein